MHAHPLVAGEPRPGSVSNPFTAPWDGAPLGTVSLADADTVDAAVASAHTAFAATAALPAHRRRALLTAISRALAADETGFAELIAREVAKPVALARGEVQRAVETFALGAEESVRRGGDTLPLDRTAAGAGAVAITRRVPRGPVLAITPFNFPLNLVAHKLAPAFAVGAPVVLKPAPQAPLTAARLAGVVHRACDEAGVSRAILQMVPCPNDIAEAMVRDPRLPVVSFTGSDAVGWKLRAAAPRKTMVLELGGNAALIAAADADVDDAVARAVAGGFAYAGQVCIKAQRLFVHADLYEAFVAKLTERVAALPVCDPMDAAGLCSALIDERSARRVRQWIADAVAGGATVRCGGGGEGSRVPPAVVTGAVAGMRLVDDEVFGPVVTVHRWSDADALFAEVNAGRYGLQAGLLTRDLGLAAQAFRRLEVGAVILGDGPTFRVDAMPYGGVKDSGAGREGVRSAVGELTDLRMLVWRGLG